MFTTHEVAGVGPFDIATDPDNHDDMHCGIRNSSQFLHSTIHYIISRLSAGDRFVDVGANLGTYSIPVARKGCHVLAIEASADNFVLLSRSALKNRLTNLIPVHAAALDRDGVVNLTGSSAWATVTASAGGPTVPALRLDELLELHRFGPPDLVKLDIEGSELSALRGLEKHISNGAVREIVIEVNEPACQAAGYSGEELLRYLHDRGFETYMFVGNVLVPRRFDDFREVYNCDFLAVSAPSWRPPEGFVIAPLPLEASVAMVVGQIDSGFESCRAYIEAVIDDAPEAIRIHPDVVSALRGPAIAEESGDTPVAQLDRTLVSTGNATKRVAILAPRAAYCGIAHYARNLHANMLAYGFRVDLVTFDDELMRKVSLESTGLADQRIEEIGRTLRRYDAVFLHLEPSTLSDWPRTALRRFRSLLGASVPFFVDFHTIVELPARSWLARIRSMLDHIPGRRHRRHAADYAKLWRQIYGIVRDRQTTHPTGVLVHTARDHEFLSQALKFGDVRHHPLSYIDPDDREAIRREGQRLRDEIRAETAALGPEPFFIGVFGFIARHKGIQHAIDALTLLGPAFKLVVFGQLHPARTPHGGSDPYLDSLLAQIAERGLTGRVLFRANLDDRDFMRAVASVDLAVFPYYEVGQRSSGPIQIAAELGKPIACSRTLCFQALAEYYPGRFQMFDVGNHTQIAQIARTTRAKSRDLGGHEPAHQLDLRSYVRSFDDWLIGVEARSGS